LLPQDISFTNYKQWQKNLKHSQAETILIFEIHRMLMSRSHSALKWKED